MHHILCFLSVVYVITVSANKTRFEKNGITFEKDEDGDYSLLTHEILVLQPGSVADVEDMERLYLLDEDFTDMEPGTFQNLPNLRRLIITMNKVPKIKTGIFNPLTNLTLLDLSANRVSHVDSDAFDNMTSLENINLSNNRLTSVDSRWFESTPAIKFIHVGYNQLTEIPAKVFGDIKSPGPFTLIFDGNMITNIDKDAFKGLTTLSMLSLETNKLTTVNGNFLEGLQVDVLILKDNIIKCVDQEHFATIFVANETDISNNPWTPECVTQIEAWAKEHHKVVDFGS
ncbi:hypothetical protein Zmor_000751 [Zophobas morio]|uniref:Uncharacterized protein n=1 Tax=Zophobas morio TaxID=2755281 RepID=A0AA38IXQ1_9CUCU|nr:hypothetical protein Zmor_000751 [Zophobas morio]